MKILFCGKGGSGKSTLAAMTALGLRDRQFKVLVVDMDESNDSLHRLLGVKRPVPVLDGLGGKKGLREKSKPAFAGPQPGADPLNAPIRLDNLPPQWIGHAHGIGLLVIGKIHDFGEGCACPMGGLTRSLLSGLVLGEREVVIIDTSAGVEHFGRGIDGLCDVIIGVVDPSYESLSMAGRMHKLAQGAKAEIYFVFNKVVDGVEALMEDHFAGQRLLARIPYDTGLFMAGLTGAELQTTLPGIEPICRLVE